MDGEGVKRLLQLSDDLPVMGPLAEQRLRHALRGLFSSDEGISSAKDHLQSLLMRLPLERVNFIQSAGYDYYEELQEEYRFLLSRSGLTTKAEVYGNWLQHLRWKLFPRRDARNSTEATGTYVAARNFSDVQEASS